MKPDYFIFLIVFISIFALFLMYDQKINTLEENLIKVNEARIKAENKHCCQVIQERYIDKMLDENGYQFIYEEHPQIIECE